jgi:glycine betaine/proline transport system permease protein
MPAPVAIIVFSLIAWQIPARHGRRDADFADCHRRHRRLVAGDGHPGAGADRPAVLHGYRPAAGDLAGAQCPRAAKIIRPLLDAMQTTPAFVYLVPIVMLFGIGNVPGVVVTIIFALPPIVV